MTWCIQKYRATDETNVYLLDCYRRVAISYSKVTVMVLSQPNDHKCEILSLLVISITFTWYYAVECVYSTLILTWCIQKYRETDEMNGDLLDCYSRVTHLLLQGNSEGTRNPLCRDKGSQRLLFVCKHMSQSRRKCSITLTFFHIFIEKGACNDFVWYDEHLGRRYQKWKILTLIGIFAYNSKSILPQRASFRHAGTQMVTCWTVT